MEQARRRRVALRTEVPKWTLVASHGLVLLYVAANRNATIREVALTLQLTERRVAVIVADLADENLLQVTRVGRRNRYTLVEDARFRHPMLSHIPFVSFVELWRLWEGRNIRGARRINTMPELSQ